MSVWIAENLFENNFFFWFTEQTIGRRASNFRGNDEAIMEKKICRKIF